jgi:hypothetical protein
MVPGEDYIQVSGLIKVLSVAIVQGELVMYCIVNTDYAEYTDVVYNVVGTGHEFDVNKWVGRGFQDSFLGTHVTETGYVWHVWYKLGS